MVSLHVTGPWSPERASSLVEAAKGGQEIPEVLFCFTSFFSTQHSLWSFSQASPSEKTVGRERMGDMETCLSRKHREKGQLSSGMSQVKGKGRKGKSRSL